MNVYNFIKKYPDIANKSGVYAISNPDSRKGQHFLKVGETSNFTLRFTGSLGSSYTTAWAIQPFLVHAVMLVPNIKHHGWTATRGKDGKSKEGTSISRTKVREKEVHQQLEDSPFVTRIRRPATRDRKARVTEWFESKQDDTELVITHGFEPVWRKHGDCRLYVCDTWDCKLVTRED